MRRPVIIFIAFAALSTVTPGLEGQSSRALELGDYYALKAVGSPDLSPDGRWVAYTVSTPVEVDNSMDVETWLVPSDGSDAPVAVRIEGREVTEPRWLGGLLRVEAADSSSWLVDPERLSNAPVPAPADEEDGVVSPDGRWRAVVHEIPRPASPTPELTDFEQRHADRFEGVQFDWYPFVRDGQEFPLPDRSAANPSEIFLERTDGSTEPLQLTQLGLQPQNVSWSPDGRTLLFTADPNVFSELLYARTDMFVVDVEGEVTRLTDDGFTYSGVRFSPDGNWISYVRSFGTDYIIDRKLDHGGPRDLYVRPAAGGEPVNLTADFDLDAGTPLWAPDSRHMYFTTGIGGAVHLFRVAPDPASVEQVTTGLRRIRGLSIDEDFERMAYTVGHFDRPPEIWTADIDGSNERRLTSVHADFLASVEPSGWEQVLYESFDGTPIEGFLLYPHGYVEGAATEYPLIVVNHGGPHSASGYGFNFKNQLFAANGYFVFLPNFRSSTGYGDEFKWGTWGAWGTKDGEDALAGVDHLIETYPIDPGRVGSTGHSYGGILTNWLITRYPDRFRAAVSGAGASNWTSNYAHSDVARTKELEFFGRPWEPRAREIMIRQSAYLNSGGVQAATLFVHGEVDYRVPLEGAIQLYTSLKKQGVAAELIIYEGQAHGIRGHWNNVHRMMNELRWWETYLKPTGRLASDG
ncbi:MAG: S9 family peptidase [Gemmatimonadetes bacterium]|nr:S9 family peptidase [Gemmatimonadota bacterium]